jgi:hypothetical protein
MKFKWASADILKNAHHIEDAIGINILLIYQYIVGNIHRCGQYLTKYKETTS